MGYPIFPSSCAFRFWFVSLAFAAGAASSGLAQEAYRLNDGGKARDLVVASDEIQVIQPGAAPADLKTRVERAYTGSAVQSAGKGQALVKVPSRATTRAGAANAAALSGAVAGAEVEAVLYPPAAVRNRMNRRVATADVLAQVPAGETAAGLAAASGARIARPTALPNRVMLHFASGFEALDAARALQARGVAADVQLRRQHVPHFLPNDPFFQYQWHLRNVGQSGATRGIDANVVDAWDITRGAGATIAVVDDGVQTTHPDLQPNCPPISSGFHHDFNGGDNNPAPVNDSRHQDEHGTSVSGVAAGKGNNGTGISGAAPDAQLVGIRLISEATTDTEDASALYWHPAGLTVGVCNNSWGPTVYYDGPGPLAKQAIGDAATQGRNGKGQVTVFSGGNSQGASDGSRDANGDSFANSRFVIAVGAINSFGGQSSYSERGANLLVSAPSSDSGALGIWTTDDLNSLGYNPGFGGEPGTDIDPQQAYTNSFGGTSSAAPLVSGCVALMLAANPNLGWRDVHEIVAATAVQVKPTDPDWFFNGGGFKFNHRYGGGMINAAAAVARGLDWDNLGPEEMQTVSATGLPVAVPENSTGISLPFDFSAGPNLRVERAELVLKMTHDHRSDVEITLTSPSGMKSIFSQLRPRPASNDDYDDDKDIAENGDGWTFTTTHSWGENSTGTWTLTAKDLRAGTTGTIDSAILRLYGTTAPFERVAFEAPLYSVGEGGTSKTVRVVRVGTGNGSFSVDVLTSTHGTATPANATAAQDFEPVNTTLNFAAGENFKDIVVPVYEDTEDENTETIYLLLKNPVGAALGGVPLAAIKIADDDIPTVSLVATDPNAAETGSGAPNPGSFTISRTNADPTPLTVKLSIGGTAVGGTDYQPALPTTATIPADASSVTLKVNPVNDSTVEGSETVTATLVADSGYVVGDQNSGTVTIADDDLYRVQITASATSIPENATAPVNLTVTRGAADSRPLTVYLTTAGTAQPGVNYEAIPAEVEIPAGQASVLVPLQPLNDTTYTPSQTVIVSLGNSPEYGPGFSKSVTVRIIDDDPVPDMTIPTVKIIAPRNKTRFDAPAQVVASGTASDNISVARVHYTLNGGPSLLANGTTSWGADLTADLVPGPNTLVVQSEDGDHNLSKEATLLITYVQQRILTVSVAGSGSVSKVPDSPEAGQTYTITAKPEKGFVFAGWSDGITSPSRALTFVMPNADTHLVASFTADPFNSGITGVYTGSVRTAAFDFTSCGLLQLALNAKGSCSGKLFLGGAKLSFKGEFNGLGQFQTRILRRGSTPLDLNLTVALNGGSRVIAGAVTDSVFTADIDLERAGFSRAAPYALAVSHPRGETYNFHLPPPASPVVTDPLGSGHGSFKVDKSGNVKWAARLRDGTVASGAAPLYANRSWPFFASLYKSRGLALGTFAIDKTMTPFSVTGSLDWFKPAIPGDHSFAAGFTLEGETAAGSLYTPPPRGAAYSAFGPDSVSDGSITFADGNLNSPPAPFFLTLTCGPDNKAVVVDGSPSLSPSLKINAAKGTFTGTFVDPKFPAKKTTLKFGGVILQDTSVGAGDFTGVTSTGDGLQTGSVTINLR